MEVKKIFSSILTVCFLMSASIGNAAVLTITVVDEAGVGVPDAEIVLRKDDDGILQFATTGSDGSVAITLEDNKHYGYNANAQNKMPSYYDGVYTDFTDYAFAPFGELGDTHRISISTKF